MSEKGRRTDNRPDSQRNEPSKGARPDGRRPDYSDNGYRDTRPGKPDGNNMRPGGHDGRRDNYPPRDSRPDNHYPPRDNSRNNIPPRDNRYDRHDSYNTNRHNERRDEGRGKRRSGCGLSMLNMILFIIIVVIGAILLAGCTNRNGNIRDVMTTKWFTFEVTDVYVDYEYEYGREYYECYDGYKFVAVDMNIRNTGDYGLEMYYDDFYLIDGRNTYLADIDPALYKFFDIGRVSVFRFSDEGEYSNFYIEPYENAYGRLIFIVNEDSNSAHLTYTEYDEFGRKGNTFKVKLY